MAEQLQVQVSVTKLGNLVYEIHGVMKGRFYKRLFVGYTESQALELFEEYLGEQL